MARKPVNKISDKLVEVNDNFNVTMYDNGFLLEISGKCHDDEWRTVKIMVHEPDRLIELIQEAVNMPREGDEEEGE